MYKISPELELLAAQRRKAERKYSNMIDRLLREVERKIEGLTDPNDIIRTLKLIAMSPQFARLCEEAALNIATMTAVGQKATWRAAAASSSQGRAIYKALKAETTNTLLGQAIQDIVIENSKLIKTVPRDMAERFSKLAQQRWSEGVRPSSITKEMLAEAKHLREFEARRIARTESAKASTALVQSRAEAMNLDFYIWRTARDGDRVRESHQIMEGVICRWSDPPNPERLAGVRSYNSYHAGGIFNCRCIALPVIALEDISFPAKVHISGRIETIQSLQAFKERFGIAA